MGDDKVQELLLKLLEDMSYVKTKLENIDDQKIGSRLDSIEGKSREHERIIKSLEKRSNTIEEFTRNNINDAKKQQTQVFISIGLAIFSAIMSFIVSILQ